MVSISYSPSNTVRTWCAPLLLHMWSPCRATWLLSCPLRSSHRRKNRTYRPPLLYLRWFSNLSSYDTFFLGLVGLLTPYRARYVRDGHMNHASDIGFRHLGLLGDRSHRLHSVGTDAFLNQLVELSRPYDVRLKIFLLHRY